MSGMNIPSSSMPPALVSARGARIPLPFEGEVLEEVVGRTSATSALQHARPTHPLAPSLKGGGNATPAREELRTAAAELVSSAFLMPMFALLRESPLRPQTGAFAPGAAEKRFGPLLDERLADSVARASGFSLIDAIVDRYSPATSGLSAPPSQSAPSNPLTAKETIDVRA